jgi:glycine betaine/proline transport system substrate-binding protein
MNTTFKMTYLSGGDDVFGPNYGGANVFTNVRAGYLQQCPNVGAFMQESRPSRCRWKTKSWARS